MSLRLYEIADQYQSVLSNLYDHETGVVDETALEKINELTDTLETKCINVTKFFKTLEMAAEGIEKERKAMQAREQALKKQISSLRDYLKFNMEKCGISKIECPQFILSVQKNPSKLEIYDEGMIPPQYEVMTLSLDEAKIKEELKNGKEIPGARLVQGTSLRIK